MVGRKGEYLWKKPGSDVWRIRLQYPASSGKPPLRKSLGTTVRAEAEILALGLIHQHKIDLHGLRKAEGLSELLRQHPTFTVAPGWKPPEGWQPFAPKPKSEPEPLIMPTANGRPVRPKRKDVSAEDTRMLEAFIGHRPRNSEWERECRDTWAVFRAFVGGKAMSEITRQDGRDYADHLRKEKGLKTATIKKRISYLSGPLGFDPSFHHDYGNPFTNAVIAIDDAVQILSLTEDEMKLCRDHMLPVLKPNEELLWKMCATMGLRNSEAFEVETEFEHAGIRYVKVGQKTKDSRRSIPLPDCLLPFLPKRITGPLFTSSCKLVSKNLLNALRRVGIVGKGKVTYSLRHRVHDRLDLMDCPDHIQRLIVGHTGKFSHVRKDSHDRYGSNPLVEKTKPFMDQIGF